ncbi:MAG: prolipoprotein diacylglyceryl transferase [Thermaerobacter sp.]|nr:prolipoprotein diacylglyceryl transferase [Thermaerobacter sp.]
MYIPQLSPYIIHFGGSFGLRWYGLFMALSMLYGAYYIVRHGIARGLSENALTSVAIWSIIGGVVGARLVFVFANDPGWIVNDPLQVFRIWQGGLAWDGGLLGGLSLGYITARRNKLPFQALLDLAVPGLSFGYILVRIGNIFNHEVLGRFTEMGFRWPAQLIGSAIGAFLLWRFFYIARKYKSLPDGYQFWTFNLWYQVFRALIEESVRQNPLYVIHYVNHYLGIGFITIEQWFSPLIFAIAGVMYLRVMRRYRRDGLVPAAQGDMQETQPEEEPDPPAEA